MSEEAGEQDDTDVERIDGEAAPKKKRSPSPNKLGKKITEENRLITDKFGSVFLYGGAFWSEVTTPQLQALAFKADDEFATKINRRNEIIGYIKASTYMLDLSWGRVKDSEVACADCVVDVLTGKKREHRPEDYLERVLPWNYSPAAKCPLWRDALSLMFDADREDCHNALQEFAGYVVLSHAKYKQALLLYGKKDTAKSLIVKVLQHLVGMDYTCQLSVEAMDDPVQREVLIGKGLNVITELSVEAMIKDGGFKTLVSTEEPIMINPKYKPTMTYTPHAKHVIATNNLPRITDKTEATFERLLLIPLLRKLAPEEQDRELADKIRDGEMEGVLAWAIEGAKRLVERHGQWVPPASAASATAEYREAENPMRQFLRQRAVGDATAAVTLSQLTEEFNRWHGGRKLTIRQIGDLARKADQVVKQVRSGDNVSTCLVGWRLNTALDLATFKIKDTDAISAASEIDEQPGSPIPPVGDSLT